MTMLFHVILVLMMSMGVSASCGVAEEGKSHEMFYVVPGVEAVTSAQWYQQVGTRPTQLVDCAQTVAGKITCSSRDSSKYETETPVTNRNFTLTILNVSRVGLQPYIFISDAQQQPHSCDLHVYTKPESPRCQPPTLTPDNTALSVICSTDKVFPQVQCVFNRQGAQIEKVDDSYVSYSHVNYTTSDNVTYYNSTCTLTYPVNTTGLHTFEVEMFVNMDGNSYGHQHLSPGSINLTLPEGRLATDCPRGDQIKDGYIKTGTTATCRCNRVHDGLPVGQVQWYNSAGQEVDTVESGDGSATISVSATNNVLNYTCKGKSNLGIQLSGESFSLKVAYGPQQVTISRTDSTSTTIDLCPNTNHDITIQCQVSRDDVSPHPNFIVLFNGTSKGVSSGSNMYMYTMTDTLDTAGNLTATCRAVNSVFSDLSKEDELQTLVREPPISPPKLIINSDNQANNQAVVENKPFHLSCRVDGGFPLVRGVTVTCRSDHNTTTVTSNNNVVSQMVTVRRDMDGAQCNCVANHVTGCYSNNQTRVNLTVTYEAAIKTFTVNQSHILTIDVHDHINLTCVADGNPTPNITIRNQRATDHGADVGHRLTYIKDNVACTDAANYTCQVTNFLSKDESSKAQVQVFVKCPQQPQNTDNTALSGVVGDSVILDLDVIGYPAPKSYTLRQRQTVVAQVNTTDGNGESGTYHFKYLSDDPPFGTVQVTIGNLSQDHFTNYRLAIDNGVGQAVEYNFVLQTEIPSSDPDIVPIVVGVIGGVLLLVVIVAVILLLKRRGVFDKKDRGHSSKLDDNEEEHVIPNDLYSGGSNSGEVVVDNSDLYSGNWNRKSNEVVIDNSDLYSGFSKQGSNEVVVDNSALYGKSDDFKETREALYKNYTDVTPSMTSATAVPVNMKAFNGARQGGNNSYEDVEVGAKPPGPSVQPKPKVAVKPMTATKPTPAPKPGGPSASGPQGAFALQDDGGDQTYASVIKTGKPQAPKTQPASQRESDYFPDQSKKPEVPEKKYEQEESLTQQEGKKKEQKKPSADKKNKNKKADEIPMVSQAGAAASSSHDNPYVNGGFTEDDGNVYANTKGNKSRKD